MADRPNDPTREMDSVAAEMQHDLEEIASHVEQAREKAPNARIDKKGDLAGTAGDVREQEGGPMFGEDPAGAVDDEHAR